MASLITSTKTSVYPVMASELNRAGEAFTKPNCADGGVHQQHRLMFRNKVSVVEWPVEGQSDDITRFAARRWLTSSNGECNNGSASPQYKMKNKPYLPSRIWDLRGSAGYVHG